MKPVIRSIEDAHGERCVDFVLHADGTCTYKLYRRDPEDHGRWSIVTDYSGRVFPDLAAAYAAARLQIAWLPDARNLTGSQDANH